MKKLRAWAWRIFCLVTGTPHAVRAAGRILRREFGHGASVRRREPVDARGREIPWFTYPAIEYLGQLYFSDKSVFEFGAGNSTLFWVRTAGRVVSVEHDPVWFERVRGRTHGMAHATITHAADPAAYVQALRNEPGLFDVIVVDGIERPACCAAALERLRPGGFVILDNADWHHRCAALLRAGGLIEVDFSGFGPINDYTWTTSLFLHREFAFRPRLERQPAHGIGSQPIFEREP